MCFCVKFVCLLSKFNVDLGSLHLKYITYNMDDNVTRIHMQSDGPCKDVSLYLPCRPVKIGSSLCVKILCSKFLDKCQGSAFAFMCGILSI